MVCVCDEMKVPYNSRFTIVREHFLGRPMGASDRWGDLASELGIEAPPPSPSPLPEPPKPVPLARPPVAAAPRPPKPATDWSRLAGDLGIDASVTAAATPAPTIRQSPTPPVASPPAAPSLSTERPQRESRHEPRHDRSVRTEQPPERSRTLERPAREQQYGRRAPIEAAAEPDHDFDESEPAAFEPLANMDIERDEFGGPASSESGTPGRADEEHRTRRRRRRGRGGRGRSQRDGRDSRDSRSPRPFEPVDVDNPPAEPDVSDAPWSVDPSQRGGNYRAEAFDDAAMLDEDGLPMADESMHPDAPRKRRRRRRGGRGRKRGERTSAMQGDADVEREDSLSDDLLDIGEMPSKESFAATAERASDATDDDFDHESELHKGHRAVPSWEEAVGFLVSANLESRARSPESRGQHRGGRGRGRGRGGRGQRDSR